jgi:thioesterase domain-containing protein
MSTTASPAQDLIQFIRDEIPLAHSMDLRLHSYDEEHIAIAAPLGPNVNDKGCAFGGSLVSLMTLSGWSLVELELRTRGYDCDVFVGESTVHYLNPVWGDFLSEARLGPQASWTTFFATLAARGRARIEVACRVPGEAPNKPAATLSARFVAKRRD